jgi:hypothetical protein
MGKAKRLLVLDTIRRKDLPKDIIFKAMAEAKYIAERNLGEFTNTPDIDLFCAWHKTPSGREFWASIFYAKDKRKEDMRMSHFYATVIGHRGLASRTGTKSSGIVGEIKGWNIGAKVVIRHVNGKDVVSIYRTGGSRAKYGPELIKEFQEET